MDPAFTIAQSSSNANPTSTTPVPAVPTNASSTNTTGSGPLVAEKVEMEEVVASNAATAEAIARQNQTVAEEFQYLLEKSQQLFAGLRELPPTGSKQWQPYFQKTFEVFAK
ncbi:hypothetical protein BGW38_009905, partial [Lunasporangiospora selenospora]